MNSKWSIGVIVLGLAVVTVLWGGTAAAQIDLNPPDPATEFTYQGYLEKPPGTPMNAACDFRFGLWDAATGGALVPTFFVAYPNPDPSTGVDVNRGVFTTTLNYGPGAIEGAARWLAIEVKCPGDSAYQLLSPRTQLTAAPHALWAGPWARNVVTPLAGWGDNAEGETNVPAGEYTAVAAGSDHSLAIRTDGTLVGWGLNSYGQVTVPGGTFTAVAAGRLHSLAIRTDGTLAAWGLNSDGQTNVPAGFYTSVAAGWSHSLAITDIGTLQGWGKNDFGQTNVPPGDFTAIAAGADHGLAIRTNGTLVGWGKNNFGQAIVPSGTYVAVAAGTDHSLAIRTDGTLVGWGSNAQGQINVPSGTFTAVAAGLHHSLAIRTDGTLVGWGYNGSGQTSVPEGRYAAVVGGVDHSLAIELAPGDGLSIDAPDGVGIGTNSPATPLDVWGGGIRASRDVDQWIQMQDHTSSGAFLTAHSRENNKKQLIFQNFHDGTGSPAGPGVNIVFRVGDEHGPVEVLRLTENATVGIGRTPTTNKLELEGNASKTTSGSWLANSDARIKKNIETIASALDTLDKVRLVTFEYTDEYRAEHASIQSRRYMNVIAQEFGEVFPDEVKGSGDRVPGTNEEILQVDPYPLTIYSAAAVQELHQLVKTQQAEIDILKSRAAAMERALSANAQPAHPVSLASIGGFAIPALALLGFASLLVRGRMQNGGGR